LNSERNVLLEKSKTEGYLSGYTDNYIRIEIPFIDNALNTIKKLKLKEINENGLVVAELAESTVHY
jgi:threonylcarbamoyladenosine tRNA methylthiotransferase MtaB